MKKPQKKLKAVVRYIKRHKSIGKAAKAANIHKSVLAAWATGFRKPDPEKLDIYSEKLGIPKEQLRPDIFGTPSKKRAA